jgi:hypothetical protein
MSLALRTANYLIIGQKHTKLKPAAQYFVIYAY